MTHYCIYLATIGEITTNQPAFPKTYPILPSAPPPQQNYGSISEVIHSQPSVQNIVIVGACPICRIGKFDQ